MAHYYWTLDSTRLAHWPLALSLSICYRRFPRHSACTRMQDQARNRLETVWSLSEIDKIENGLLDICVHLQGSRLLENGIFALLLERLRPPVATLWQKYRFFFQINVVKVFSSAVYQETALYAQVGKASVRVRVAQCTAALHSWFLFYFLFYLFF